MSYFFKIVIGEWKTKLRIPRLFVSSFSLTPNTVILINPSSRERWVVDIEEEGEDPTELYFKEGWSKFVKDNALEAGDFLIFKFDGESRFEVIICGKSACEKMVETQAKAQARTHQSLPRQGHNKQRILTGDRGEKSKGNDVIDVERQKFDIMIKEERVDPDECGTTSQETWDETWAGQSEDEDEDDEADDDYDEEEEEEEEKEESDEFDDIQSEPHDSVMNIGEDCGNLGSEIPSFTIHLQHAYAKKGCMCMPTEFFHKYMRKERQEVEIETEKGAWKVTLLPHMKRTRTFARFSKGWSEFARQNHFQTGQTLIFKMIRRGKCSKFLVQKQKTVT